MTKEEKRLVTVIPEIIIILDRLASDLERIASGTLISGHPLRTAIMVADLCRRFDVYK